MSLSDRHHEPLRGRRPYVAAKLKGNPPKSITNGRSVKDDAAADKAVRTVVKSAPAARHPLSYAIYMREFWEGGHVL